MILIFQMRKLRPRDVMQLIRGHSSQEVLELEIKFRSVKLQRLCPFYTI